MNQGENNQDDQALELMMTTERLRELDSFSL